MNLIGTNVLNAETIRGSTEMEAKLLDVVDIGFPSRTALTDILKVGLLHLRKRTNWHSAATSPERITTRFAWLAATSFLCAPDADGHQRSARVDRRTARERLQIAARPD